MLKKIRANGFGVWGVASPIGRVAQLYQQVISVLGTNAATEELRTTLTELLMSTGGSAYSMTHLKRQDGGSVSFMIAPVFDRDGRAVFEVGLQVFQSSMSYREIERCSERLLRAAGTVALEGGPPPRDHRQNSA
jgi:hypothetical protein